METDPNDARGYGELGYVRLYQKEHDRSIAAYERALALNPNEANILAEMGDALAHAGRPEEALPYIQKAISLNPFYPDQYLWAMADAYMRMREFEKAIGCVQRMNNPALGARILACCYAHLGQMTQARHMLSGSARHSPASTQNIGQRRSARIAARRIYKCS